MVESHMTETILNLLLQNSINLARVLSKSYYLVEFAVDYHLAESGFCRGKISILKWRCNKGHFYLYL